MCDPSCVEDGIHESGNDFADGCWVYDMGFLHNVRCQSLGGVPHYPPKAMQRDTTMLIYMVKAD